MEYLCFEHVPGRYALFIPSERTLSLSKGQSKDPEEAGPCRYLLHLSAIKAVVEKVGAVVAGFGVPHS
jgi:hypothetical protein